MSTENQNPEEVKNQEVEANETENTQAQENNAEEQEVELTAEEKLQQELEEAKKTIADEKDKYLRLSAEFDNYRKRTLKEKAELIKNGGEKAISAILPILDDIERALQNMKNSDNVESMYEGVELISQKFLKALGQEGLEKMETIGEVFDTDFHEAVALVPTPEEDKKGKILDCVQTGYKLHDKVIRHAKVVVAQ